MTVKELKEKLEKYPDDFIVVIPYPGATWDRPYTHIEQVLHGVNEMDTLVILTDYVEEDE